MNSRISGGGRIFPSIVLCFAQKSVLLGDASDVLAGDDSVLVPSNVDPGRSFAER